MTELGEGWDLGDARHAFLARYGERAQSSGLDVRQRRGQVVEEHLHLPAERVVQRRAGAAVGNVRQVDLGRVLEGLADEVAQAAHARRAVVELAGVFPRVLDELGHVARRHRRMDRHGVRHGSDLADEGEVLQRVVAQIFLYDGIDDMRREGRDAERIAVGNPVGDGFGADRAACATAVIDDERLPELARHAVGRDAADDVGRAAGREGDDQGHRPGRIPLGERLRAAQREECEQSCHGFRD